MNGALSPATVRYTLGFLFVVNLVNLLDRQIVNILAEPIKQELRLADWQIGVMSGLAFAIFYTFLGIPLARRADSPRVHRGKLISVCLAVWSGMTALCGVAGNFAQLLAARVGVAIGEAGCSPTAHSLISHIVPANQRAAALAIYSMGIPAGKLLGLLIGGVVAQALGWRHAFLVVGIPGVLLAILSWFTLPDPRTQSVTETPTTPLREVARLLKPLDTFWFASLGGAFVAFLSYGQSAFLGSFLIRVHGLTVGEAGTALGLAMGIGGTLGSWIGGWAADRGARTDARAYMLVPAGGALAGAALFAAMPLVDSVPMAIGLLAIGTGLTSTWYGPLFATVQSIVPREHRATAAAVHLFIINLIGIGLGPLTFGLLSDGFNRGFEIAGFEIGGRGSAEGVRYALVAGSSAGVIAALFLLIASRTIREQLKRA